MKNKQGQPRLQKNQASPDLASFNGDHRSTLDPRDIAPSRIFEEALDGGHSIARVATLANNGSNPIKIPHVERPDSPGDEGQEAPLARTLDLPTIKTQREGGQDADPRLTFDFSHLKCRNPFSVAQRPLPIKNHQFNYDCFTMQNSGSSTSLGSQEPRAAVPFLA